MNHEAESRINQELGFNERLFWADIPKQGFVLRASDAFTMPFSILWCGLTISWESGIMESDASLFMTIWEISFILIGLYLLFGRFIVDAIDRSKTCYGITSERIIIIEEAFGKTKKVII